MQLTGINSVEIRGSGAAKDDALIVEFIDVDDSRVEVLLQNPGQGVAQGLFGLQSHVYAKNTVVFVDLGLDCGIEPEPWNLIFYFRLDFTFCVATAPTSIATLGG